MTDAGQSPKWLPSEPAPDQGSAGWLAWFDVIIVHDSGGKDSQTVKRHALRALRAAGVMDRVAVLHLVLDRAAVHLDGAESRIEWPQVPELAAEQSARHGVPLGPDAGWGVWNARTAKQDLTSRTEWAGQMHYARLDADGDLLDYIQAARKRDGSLRSRWPTMWTRFCTSDWKTGPGRNFTEWVCRQVRTEQGLTRPARVLQIMGFRAEESRDRAARSPYALNYGVSAQHSRHVWEWLPIHTMTVANVWTDIRASGIPYHPVYDEGMSRLSCRLCIMGSRSDLSTARRLTPDTYAEYVTAETAMGDSFQQNKPLAEVPAAAGPEGLNVLWTACPTCAVRVLTTDREPARHCPAHAKHGPWERVPLTLFSSDWHGACSA